MRVSICRWILILLLSTCVGRLGAAQEEVRGPDAVEKLAAALAAAQKPQQRAALIAGNKELVTVALVQALIRQANELTGHGRYALALQIYGLAQTTAAQLNDKAGLAYALKNIGNVCNLQGKFTEALDYYRKSMSLYEAVEDKKGIASILGNIGTIHDIRGDYAQAVAFNQKCLSIYQQLSDNEGIASTLGNLGIIHYARGDYPRALEFHQKSLAISETLKDRTITANELNNLGIVCSSMSDYRLALDYFRKSLSVNEELKNAKLASTLMGNIGNIYRLLGNYEESLRYFLDSLELAESMNDKQMQASSLLNMGIVRSQRGEYASAIDCYQRVLNLSEAMGEREMKSRALNSLGIVEYSHGNYARALEYYQKSLKLKEELGKREGIASSLGNIGEVYHAQGNYDQALEFYRKSMALSESLGDKNGVATMLSSIGGVYLVHRDYARALEHYAKSLAQSEAIGDQEGIAFTLNSIGDTHELQGSYAQAMTSYKKSLAVFESLGHRARSDCMQSMAEVYRSQGDYSRALELTGRAGEIARQTENREALWKSLTTSGRCRRALNQNSEARKEFEEAIAIIEGLRIRIAGGEEEQQRFLENRLLPYQQIAEMLLENDGIGEALDYAERAKARVLLDVLESGKAMVTKAMTAGEREKEQRFRSRLVSLNSQIAYESQRPQPDAALVAGLKDQLEKARLEYSAFQTDLYVAHPELRTRRNESRPATTEELSVLLDGGRSALLEFMVTEEKTYLFVFTANGKAMSSRSYALAIAEKDLSAQIQRFRRQLAQRALDFRELAAELYRLLLKPAQQQLEGKASIVIVPDGPLWELPFQALLSAANHFLLEDHSIAYAPSLSVLREMRRSRKGQTIASWKLLAMGNPILRGLTRAQTRFAYRSGKLAPLPEAAKEVRRLRQLYATGQCTVLVGLEASEDKFKAEARGYDVLHLATHGILNDISPMYSHLVLSRGAGGEDGLLEAWELLQLDLKADLLVLSACETARGRVSRGEGMIGLVWAAFVAGCAATVVSQWSVESASTTELMVEFHQQLRARSSGQDARASKAAALRNAALKLLRDSRYRHPFYWAGFILIGDGS
jgi:CHAT domain-containing protein/tetratricopeptide (TPR) repeat protein